MDQLTPVKSFIAIMIMRSVKSQLLKYATAELVD